MRESDRAFFEDYAIRLSLYQDLQLCRVFHCTPSELEHERERDPEGLAIMQDWLILEAEVRRDHQAAV